MRVELKKLLEGNLEVDPGASVMLELYSSDFRAFPCPLLVFRCLCVIFVCIAAIRDRSCLFVL